MSPPTVVTKPWNDLSIVEEDPKIEVHKDCVFVPPLYGNFWENFDWGIYDRDGNIIRAAAHSTYPNRALTGQSERCPLDLSSAPYAPRDRYFYIGNIINHFGHFLCSTMCRLWALPQIDLQKTPVVGHALGRPHDWFSWPFTRTLFGSAGLLQEDFADFTEPVRIREMIIANPSFVELNLAHRAGAREANAWGERLVKTQDLSQYSDVVFLTKMHLPQRSYGIGNEVDVVNALSELGVQIVAPERLTIPQQVALFKTSRVIMGEIGSAFHTCLFAEPQKGQKLICMVQSPEVFSSNHALIDGINRNNSTYLYFDGDWQDGDGRRTLTIRDPARAARNMLDIAHA